MCSNESASMPTDKFRLSRRQLFAVLTALPTITALRAPAFAAPRAAPLTPQDQAAVKRVQDYLNGIHTLQSRFQQFSQEGGIATGTIYLQRPGKMRIVYDAPVPILIVCDGWTVYYWDKKLEQVSQIGLQDTPAWFLLRPQIRLTGDVTITRFDRASGALRIAMTETEHPDTGSLTLVMSEHPLELRQWTVLDAQQRPITVALQDPHYGVNFNPVLFIWSDPRPSAHGR